MTDTDKGISSNLSDAVKYLERELATMQERAALTANLINVLTEELQRRDREEHQ